MSMMTAIWSAVSANGRREKSCFWRGESADSNDDEVAAEEMSGCEEDALVGGLSCCTESACGCEEDALAAGGVPGCEKDAPAAEEVTCCEEDAPDSKTE